MTDNPKYGYLNQPYVPELLANAPTTPGIHHIMVEHDDWCPLLLGIGLCTCRPVVRQPNRNERRRLARQQKRKSK